MQSRVLRNDSARQKSILIIAAFLAIYVFWGSTYLAIKYAIESMPPFLMAASRFLIAGTILFIWGRLSKDYERPTFTHWRTTAIAGTLLLLGGNGGVVLAERYIPSSLAALLIATEPFWIVILSWLWLKGKRPNWKVVLGLVIGFAGVWLLISGNIKDGGGLGLGSDQLLGAVAMIVASVSWAMGSIYGLRASVPKSSLLTAGMQMMSGGSALMLLGLVRGEWRSLDIATVSLNSWLGLGYLIVFGSLISFTAYSWLLKNAQPSMVATYAYVNPVIAVVLGWLIAGESMTGQMLLGAGVIVGSVVLITMQDKAKDLEGEIEVHRSVGPNRPAATCST